MGFRPDFHLMCLSKCFSKDNKEKKKKWWSISEEKKFLVVTGSYFLAPYYTVLLKCSLSIGITQFFLYKGSKVNGNILWELCTYVYSYIGPQLEL